MTPKMTKDTSQGWQELPATTTWNKPLRTYSHKAKSNRPVSLLSLPPLKPTPEIFTSTTAGVRLERFHTGNANVYRDDLGQSGVDDDTDELTHEELGEKNRLEDSQVPPHSERLGPVNEDGDDPFVLSKRPPGCTPKHDRRTGNGMRSLRRRPHLIFSRTEAKGYKQLNLSDDQDAAKSAPIPRSKYRFGDGFSGREAKPNGSNLLTRSGKQSITTPHVGILDLTQSMTQIPARKRKTRTVDTDYNSFGFAPKKKSRGPLQPKDPNRQTKPNPVIPTKVKRTTSAALGEAGKAGEEPSAPETQPRQPKEDGHIKKSQAQPIAAKDCRFHLDIPRWDRTIDDNDGEVTGKATSNNDDDEVDLLIVRDIHNTREFVAVVAEHSCETNSPEIHPSPLQMRAGSENEHTKQYQVQATTAKDSRFDLDIATRRDTIDNDHADKADLLTVPDISSTRKLVDEAEQHSWDTHVSETPPRPRRMKARSVSPESPLRWDVSGEPQPPGRELRRAKTM
ncbi:hypothetical protein B0I37DRAFT_443095 [Chaetomium sp. MPI-CAGE-AT-0009]|nr:hypothetical protein B0I37DRAFT_443095 [Chaetomium sp. MPI-CAGE-AT-0009]